MSKSKMSIAPSCGWHLNFSYLLFSFHTVHSNNPATATSTTFHPPAEYNLEEWLKKKRQCRICHRPSFLLLLIALVSQDSEAHHFSQPYQLVIAIWKRKQAE